MVAEPHRKETKSSCSACNGYALKVFAFGLLSTGGLARNLGTCATVKSSGCRTRQPATLRCVCRPTPPSLGVPYSPSTFLDNFYL